MIEEEWMLRLKKEDVDNVRRIGHIIRVVELKDLEHSPRPEKEIRKKIVEMYANDNISHDEMVGWVNALSWAYYLSEEKTKPKELDLRLHDWNLKSNAAPSASYLSEEKKSEMTKDLPPSDTDAMIFIYKDGDASPAKEIKRSRTKKRKKVK